ncbi:MAG: hypothetical protein EAZ99_07310 [Alphaproteobacteria bacterium]|nr:MAG: hypothetical protein EAZ99_07310 [Alphaproteobacteria bacterium]
MIASGEGPPLPGVRGRHRIDAGQALRHADAMTPPPRWQYRLQSFTTALSLVQEGVALLRTRPLSPLETEGLSTRFAFTWELGWKLLKDYLEQRVWCSRPSRRPQ